MIERNWIMPSYHLLTREHFYHVGSTENLRHPMIEALVTNFSIRVPFDNKVGYEQMAFLGKTHGEIECANK